MAWGENFQMINICAGETTLGHVTMQAETTAHTGVVFMGCVAKGRMLHTPSKRSSNL
jgi:hypothetical protein